MENDKELILAYQGGDQLAFNKLYERYEPEIRWYLYKRMDNKSMVEDITQDVFVKFIRFASLYDPQKGYKFRTWLYEVAKSVLYTHWQYKSAASRNKREYRLDKEDDDGRTMDVASKDFSPEDLADQSLSLSLYKKKLENMGNQYAMAYTLYSENLSYKEIADIMGVEVNTVKSRIHRARRQLL